MPKNNAAKKRIETLRERLKEVSYYNTTLGLLSWDQETNMPDKAGPYRAEVVAHLGAKGHTTFLSINDDGLLDHLSDDSSNKKLSPRDTAMVEIVLRDYEKASKLPEAFVKEFNHVVSRSQREWAHARKENNFKHFEPWLSQVMALTRTKAELLGTKGSYYETLLDDYAPGLSEETLEMVFGDLRDALVPLVKRIKGSKKSTAWKPKGTFPLNAQNEFAHYVAECIGFDFTMGHISKSFHPFTADTHPFDTRFTIRFKENDPTEAISTTLHEGGHALYGQGVTVKDFGTPLGEAHSIAVHESQSRFWEHTIGSSKPFWKFLFPKLKKAFPKQLHGVTRDEFYRYINTVKPSLIRTQADEVTYNLHIILRFEIERELMEGSIAVKDLPQIWNQKMKEYLGVTVPHDADGVLQDVHWSFGLIGYFPSYALGNLWSAQLRDAIVRDIPDFYERIEHADFDQINVWMREKVHKHGRRYSSEALMKKATGEVLGINAFTKYLEEKYGEFYNLDN